MRSVAARIRIVVLSVFLAHAFIVGCSTIRDREVTAENTEEVMRELGQSRDVTPEEAQLVVGYLARQRIGEAFGRDQEGMLPATVAQMIERQRLFVQEAAAREQERAAAEAQRVEEERLAAQQRAAEMEALRASLPGQVLRISFIESNWRTHQLRDQIAFDVRVSNLGERAIRGVRGRFVFLDTFGTEVSSVVVSVEQDMLANQAFENSYVRDYNQFVPEDRALRNFDLTRGTVRWEPSQVVYADGTSIEVGR
jgi:hypothetical protein